MKIRIKGNSIRYRLSKTEIDKFANTGLLEERTEFLNGQIFYYSLQKKESITNLEATFSGNKIILFVPGKITAEWTTTDVVGFNNKMDIGEGKSLFLLIENDFVCLDHTFEDQKDNYENPTTAC